MRLLLITALLLFSSLKAFADSPLWIQMFLGESTRLEIPTVSETSQISVFKHSKGVDPQGWIEVITSRERRQFVSIEIQVPYSSPSFQEMQVDILEKDIHTSAILSTQTFYLRVDPVVQIRLKEEGKDVWDSPEEIYLQQHQEDVLIRFINVGSSGKGHRIHGERAIRHAPYKVFMSKAGDIYESTITGKEPLEGRYRCHEHEYDSDIKKIYFNVPQDEIPGGLKQLSCF